MYLLYRPDVRVWIVPVGPEMCRVTDELPRGVWVREGSVCRL